MLPLPEPPTVDPLLVPVPLRCPLIFRRHFCVFKISEYYVHGAKSWKKIDISIKYYNN